MADKKIYFISDLHLGATYDNQSRAKERRVVDWLQSIEDDVSELYMLGDVLDYWFEYRTVVPRGYIRFFGQLARMVDRGVKITWMIGNHDIWLFDYLRDDIGITVVDGSLEKELNGLKFYMAHGDGVGRLPLGFRFIRSVFRNRVCQKLYSAIHPRWTIPFAHRWSTHSRLAADCTPPFQGEDEPLLRFARAEAEQRPDVNFFVFGHRHLLLDIPLTSSCRFIILGDWLNHFSYGVLEGRDFSLHTLAKI